MIVGLSDYLTERGCPRSPGSIKAKVENFKAYDPMYPGVSIGNGGQTSEKVWNRFSTDGFKDLHVAADKARETISKGAGVVQSKAIYIDNFGGGEMRSVERKERVNQGIFRARVLDAYRSRCCVTGTSNSYLLRASHIKPWADSPEGSAERLDPRNGLCLNALHDAAFDKGLFTLDEGLRVELSSVLEDTEDKTVLDQMFYPYVGKRIHIELEDFAPSEEYLDYHRKNVFRDKK